MKSCSSLEFLESRIAPATLLSPTTFSYTDVDGDSVRVVFSKPILTPANFDTLIDITGDLAGTGPQDLRTIDLVGLASSNNGLNITVTATPSRTLGGDGVIAGLGIDAFDEEMNVITGLDLGTVKIDGDLSFIDAGDVDSETMAIKLLTTKTIGLIEPGVVSELFGPIGTVKISGDFAGYFNAGSDNLSAPDFRIISIGGSVLGNLGENAGRIDSFGGIDNLAIRGDVVGGSFAESGSIWSAAPILKVSIGGSLIGGGGDDSGQIRALEMTSILIRGSLIGGFGNRSGALETNYGDMDKVTIYGSVFGGKGDLSGSIRAGSDYTGDGTIGNLYIRGSVIGAIPESGNLAFGTTIRADNSISRLTINGVLLDANIVAGVQPGGDNRYATADDTLTIGFPNALRTLGPVLIKGGVYASTAGFGITAPTIISLAVGGPVLKPGGVLADFGTGFLVGGGLGIRVVEFA